MSTLNRREAFKRTALAMGYTISAPTVTLLFNSCDSKSTPLAPTVFLSKTEARLVDQMSECILPKTDTPGVQEVQVFKFVDLMLKQVFDEEEQAEFNEDLESFDEICQQEQGKSFADCSKEQQNEFMQSWIDARVKDPGDSQATDFLKQFKKLTLLAYFTSEQIGENVLGYNPIPGNYDGCIPLEEGQNIWSL